MKERKNERKKKERKKEKEGRQKEEGKNEIRKEVMKEKRKEVFAMQYLLVALLQQQVPHLFKYIKKERKRRAFGVVAQYSNVRVMYNVPLNITGSRARRMFFSSWRLRILFSRTILISSRRSMRALSISPSNIQSLSPFTLAISPFTAPISISRAAILSWTLSISDMSVTR